MKKIALTLMILALTLSFSIGVAACDVVPDSELNRGEIQRDFLEKGGETNPNQDADFGISSEKKTGEAKEAETSEEISDEPIDEPIEEPAEREEPQDVPHLEDGEIKKAEEIHPEADITEIEDESESEEAPKTQTGETLPDSEQKPESKQKSETEQKSEPLKDSEPTQQKQTQRQTQKQTQKPTQNNDQKVEEEIPAEKQQLPETNESEPQLQEETESQEQTVPQEDTESQEQTESQEEAHVHEWEYLFYEQDLASRHIKTCKTCGESESSEKCTFGKPETVAPTCTEDGYKLYTCTVCGNSFRTHSYERGARTDLKTGHTFGAWTAAGNGEHVHTCTKCDFQEKATCEYTSEVTTEPTCSTDGVLTKTCETCGNSVTSSVPALGHEFHYTISNNNQHQAECTRCKFTETKDCTFGKEVVVPATCTKNGTRTQTCPLCNNQKVEEIAPLGHDFRAVGSSETHTKTMVCSRCGKNHATEQHVYTQSNLCDICGHDGLTTIYTRIEDSGCSVVRKGEVPVTVTKIYITVTCTGIDSESFRGFTNLEEIYIPKTVFAIKNDAFDGTALTKIYYEGKEDDWNNIFENGKLNKKPVKLTKEVTFIYEQNLKDLLATDDKKM